MVKLKVRSSDRMVFEVSRENLEPKNTGCYDAYCYVDPEPGVEYMEFSEWSLKRQEILMKLYTGKM
jgi:hypothetical protein